MKKALLIAWKDLTITLRDPGALVLMLITPLALTLAMSFAFGSGNGTPAAIPVILVNQDSGPLGAALVQVFSSDELADLVAPVVMDDEAAARAAVDADQAAAAVLIPADLSTNLIFAYFDANARSAPRRRQATITVYANPARPIGSEIVRNIVEEFLNRVTTAFGSVQVTIAQLLERKWLSPQDAPALGRALVERMAREAATAQLIQIRREAAAGRDEEAFDWLAYMAPSMAIFFLMFTVTIGSRSILAERDAGTLPRLLTTPTSAAQVLGGKALGTYLTGLVQMGLLILASRWLFGVRWGAPAAVIALVLALVAAATGWGMVIAAYARTPGQVGTVGSGLSLIFGIGAGNFIPRATLPQWLRIASYISPNAWGLEGFDKLSSHGTLADALSPIAALLVMTVVLFGIAVIAFRRQYG